MTTVERHAARWPCKDGDVRWHRMGLGSNLKNLLRERDVLDVVAMDVVICGLSSILLRFYGGLRAVAVAQVPRVL